MGNARQKNPWIILTAVTELDKYHLRWRLAKTKNCIIFFFKNMVKSATVINPFFVLSSFYISHSLSSLLSHSFPLADNTITATKGRERGRYSWQRRDSSKTCVKPHLNFACSWHLWLKAFFPPNIYVPGNALAKRVGKNL